MNSKIGTSTNDTPKFVARYIENFIDLVENVPNDLSRRISRVHELQLDYETSLSKLESNLTRFSRYNNDNNNGSSTNSNPASTIPTSSKATTDNNSNCTTQPSSSSNDLRQLKLLLATQHYLAKMQEISDNKLAIVQDALDQLDNKSRELDHDFKLINAATSDGSETSATTSNNKNSKSNSSGNSKNQASSSSYSSQPKSSQRESPEPTYCVCHQVSYGDMICCDNDACEIEWFHFQCVSLTSKPKGKWYCPNCRGDRSNQPKK